MAVVHAGANELGNNAMTVFVVGGDGFLYCRTSLPGLGLPSLWQPWLKHNTSGLLMVLAVVPDGPGTVRVFAATSAGALVSFTVRKDCTAQASYTRTVWGSGVMAPNGLGAVNSTWVGGAAPGTAGFELFGVNAARQILTANTVAGTTVWTPLASQPPAGALGAPDVVETFHYAAPTYYSVLYLVVRGTDGLPYFTFRSNVTYQGIPPTSTWTPWVQGSGPIGVGSRPKWAATDGMAFYRGGGTGYAGRRIQLAGPLWGANQSIPPGVYGGAY